MSDDTSTCTIFILSTGGYDWGNSWSVEGALEVRNNVVWFPSDTKLIKIINNAPNTAGYKYNQYENSNRSADKVTVNPGASNASSLAVDLSEERSLEIFETAVQKTRHPFATLTLTKVTPQPG